MVPENTPISAPDHQTALVLANGSALTAAILKRIAGNDISNSINGSPLTQDVIHSLTTRMLVRLVESTDPAVL